MTEKHEAAVGLLEEPTEAAFMDIEASRCLRPRGRERGFLTFEEIATCLEEVEVTKEQISEFRAHLVEWVCASAARTVVLLPRGCRRRLQGLVPRDLRAEEAEIDLTVEPSLDSLRLYLRSIGRVELLTADQEVFLAQADRAWRHGRQAADDRGEPAAGRLHREGLPRAAGCRSWT